MNAKILPTFLIFLSILPFLRSQEAINTSFEDYNTGTINGQNKWTVVSGTGIVSVDPNDIHAGTKALQIKTTGSALNINQVSYAGNVPGITGIVYLDLYVKVKSSDKPFTVNAYDLFGGSQKRIFMFEFLSNGKLKIYNGSSGNESLASYVKGEWTRISFMINFSTEKYKTAVNGNLISGEYSFRETYTPTASGSRQAGMKEFHSLRFNQNTDTGTGTSDVAVDDIYIGTTEIADIDFGDTTAKWKISTTQPSVGNITITPEKTEYNDGDQVTASLMLPQGYKNGGWTGDLSGTELSKTFAITKNMSLGANVMIDETDPPAKYTVTVTPSAFGTIALDPESNDGKYYAGTKVTASVTYSACYRFNGWTGALSGTKETEILTVNSDMTIGADISENTTPAVTRKVNNMNELKTALNAVNPGDIVELADGTYNFSSGMSLTRGGCENRPVIIRAKNQGMAKLTGAVALTLKAITYVTFEGLTIESSAVSSIFKLEGCNNIRITKNTLRMSKDSETQTSKWILITDVWDNAVTTSGYNRIDHNLFDGKYDGGSWVVIDGAHGTKPGDISKYDLIDHNHFRNNTPRANNEKETVRIGVSDLTPCKAYCTVEYNLFEDCDGDPEIISAKSWNNVIRYNTFRRCLGTVCLRQGGNNRVEGNYFFGEGKTAEYNGGTIGCGGVRVYGEDHVIVNNYFEGLTGDKWDAACTITNGDAPVTSTDWSAHFIPKNVVFAFNTYVNNKSNIEIGFTNNGNYGKIPDGCVFADNIVIDDIAPIVKVHNAASLNGVSFSGNIMYPTGTSSIGIPYNNAQIKLLDPKMVKTKCQDPGINCAKQLPVEVWKITTESPARNAAATNYGDLTVDFEGQTRPSPKSVGADEFNTGEITIGALTTDHVGPNAQEFELSIVSGMNDVSGKEALADMYVLSNKMLRVNFFTEKQSSYKIRIYDISGVLLKEYSGESSAGMTGAEISLSDCPQGIYLTEVITSEYHLSKKVKL